MDPELEDINPPTDLRTLEIRSSLDGTSKVLSPIQRMPPELLGELFILCRNNSLESDESYPHSILNTREAPMVLVMYHPLWDFVSLITSSIVADRTMPFIRTLIERSRTLPLTITVANRRPMLPTALNVNAPFLCFLWDFHDRLQHIHLDISSSTFDRSYMPAILISGFPWLGATSEGISLPGIFDSLSFPALETLDLTFTVSMQTDATDANLIFQAFTHLNNSWSPPLRLPQLQKLMLADDVLEGHLRAACNTGRLVDHCVEKHSSALEFTMCIARTGMTNL
ncbi:hypothetical protein B0H13DRAFT_2069660 [Mycena leptocephala]|nr:hypothetical protein B0H13DRAFT_2069660 [Mycena leptocephala]